MKSAAWLPGRLTSIVGNADGFGRPQPFTANARRDECGMHEMQSRVRGLGSLLLAGTVQAHSNIFPLLAEISNDFFALCIGINDEKRSWTPCFCTDGQAWHAVLAQNAQKTVDFGIMPAWMTGVVVVDHSAASTSQCLNLSQRHPLSEFAQFSSIIVVIHDSIVRIGKDKVAAGERIHHSIKPRPAPVASFRRIDFAGIDAFVGKNSILAKHWPQ